MTYDPFKAYADIAKTMFEISLDAQKRCFDTIERAGQSGGLPVAWVKVEVPVVSPSSMLNETRMRESFQSMADQNLRTWEHAANLLSATPEWMQKNYSAPGAAMTEWFDRVRRSTTSMAPANDTGSVETAAEATAPAARATSAAKAEDDLTEIKGIGKKIAGRLNGIGIFEFAQIAGWTDTDVDWVEDKLTLNGRVSREKWVAQARKLAKAAA